MDGHYPLRQLEYFAATAHTGTLSEAASRCHVSQPALSPAVTQLERSPGLQLLVRHRSRGTELTPAGTRVLKLAAAVGADLWSTGAGEFFPQADEGWGPRDLPGLPGDVGWGLPAARRHPAAVPGPGDPGQRGGVRRGRAGPRRPSRPCGSRCGRRCPTRRGPSTHSGPFPL